MGGLFCCAGLNDSMLVVQKLFDSKTAYPSQVNAKRWKDAGSFVE